MAAERNNGEVTRFAPSPTGRMHLGHAYAALFAYEAAKDSGGHFLVRIEDIDTGRSKPEFEAGIFEDLAWLGIDWEKPVMRQSERMDAYEAALQKLDALGVLYPCFCTRREIAEEIARAGSAPHGPDGPLYPGTCRRLSEDERRAKFAEGRPYARRIDLEKALSLADESDGENLRWEERSDGTVRKADPRPLGDAVLARKDLGTSYHLAVTVDDAAQGVTLVTRGKDLIHATDLHRLLQALLGLPVPVWHHHGLITDDDGKRLATRDSAKTLESLKGEGMTAGDVRHLLARGA